MKVIIAGSRNLRNPDVINWAMKASGFIATEVVSGCASGADSYGESWADAKDIPVKKFPPDLVSYGNAAGPIRNKEMAGYADALVAIWDGASRGTKHMIDSMNKLNKPIYVYSYVQD